MNNKKIKIVHIINDLSPGGAEKMLLNLVAHTDRSRFDISVFSLQNKGEVAIDIEKLGIPVFGFYMFNKYDFIFKFLKLILILIRIKPDIVHAWMYHSNLIGGIAAKFVTSSKIIWSIHSTTLEPGPEKKGTEIAIKLSTFLSKVIPDKIILCSKASYNFHEIIGFEKNKMMVIPNGIDLRRFKYSSKAKLNLISKLKLGHETKFIGMVGRYHSMKRHDIFFHAAQIIINKYPLIQFILCGPGIDNSNQKLVKLINSFELSPNIHLLGYRSDMSNIYSLLDILTITSSYGESFPLTICEAMACNVPVVSTDVGDASYIINSKDMIIPINEPMLIAEKWEKIISLDIKSRNEIGVKNRSRIKNLFDIKNIERSYKYHYKQLLNFT
jgi:glycosyltransferase involved in cell wall biosynthesis